MESNSREQKDLKINKSIRDIKRGGRGRYEVGDEVGWGGGCCRAEQQLLSITSAPSGVISKQTDWNRPTEASPRESKGWTEQEERNWEEEEGG